MEDFSSMVKTQWGMLTSETPAHLGPMRSLIYRLNKLHPLVLSWEKEMKYKENHLLCWMEIDILVLEDLVVRDSFFDVNRRI